LRGVFPRRDYLRDVERGPPLGEGSFSNVYKGVWKGKEVAVKRFRPVRPPVFLIPSDTIRCLTLTLNNLQEHIEGTLKVNGLHLVFLSQHPCLNSNTSGEIYESRRGIPNLLIRLGSLTFLNNLAACLVLPRAASLENSIRVQLCVGPTRFYNVAGPGQNDRRLRPGFAPG
jgi:hypothetical protein